MDSNLKSQSRTLQTAGRIGGVFARHSLALLVTILMACIIWTVIYFALLFWAVFSGAGLGSPALYPLGLLFILVGVTTISITILFPSTALAEWIARRRDLPLLAQIPISVFLLAIFCLAITGIVSTTAIQTSFQGITLTFGLLFLSLLLPLGLYWWAAQSGIILLGVFKRLRSIFYR